MRLAPRPLDLGEHRRQLRALRRPLQRSAQARRGVVRPAQQEQRARQSERRVDLETDRRSRAVRRGQEGRRIPAAMRSALAWIVTCGFAPVLLGSDDASVT
jgi:hypothetical protein